MEFGKELIPIRATRSLGDKIFDTSNVIFIFILTLLFIYPFWNLIVISFTSAKFSNLPGLQLLPQEVSLDAYRSLFNDPIIYTAYLNTFIRTAVGTGIILFVTFFAACALSKRDLPMRKWITFIMLITLFFNGGVIPTYLNISNLGLMNSLWSLILPGMANAWYIILMRNFLMSFSSELEDAAMIDGANPLQVSLRIILPLSKPIIAVVALWSAVYHWNAWYDALLYIRSEKYYVLQFLVQKVMKQDLTSASGKGNFVRFTGNTSSEALRAATIVASIVPILLAYPFVQKHFVKGIMVGSLKG